MRAESFGSTGGQISLSLFYGRLQGKTLRTMISIGSERFLDTMAIQSNLKVGVSLRMMWYTDFLNYALRSDNSASWTNPGWDRGCQDKATTLGGCIRVGMWTGMHKIISLLFRRIYSQMCASWNPAYWRLRYVCLTIRTCGTSCPTLCTNRSRRRKGPEWKGHLAFQRPPLLLHPMARMIIDGMALLGFRMDGTTCKRFGCKNM